VDETTKSLLEDYLLESRERLERLEELLLAISSAGAAEPEAIEEIRLQLHTLKGNSGMMGLPSLQAVAHEMEDQAPNLGGSVAVLDSLFAGVDRFRDLLGEVAGTAAGEALDLESARAARDARGGLRIAFSDLDDLVDRLGEMVIYRNRLEEALSRERRVREELRAGLAGWEAVERAYEQLATSLEGLREGVTRLRMIPLATLFRPLARIVHDEARRAGKRVRFVTEGGDTPLDRALLELSSEVLGHLVRNAVVHGVEPDAERMRRGKGDGLVRLSAAADSREVRIEVLDDGGGVRVQEAIAGAARLGRTLASGEDPLQLLFLPGLTTQGDVDLSSGRGVGLAAVREAVVRRGGRVEVYSEEGVGTLFRVRLPLSVSITRALLLGSDGEDYVLPLASVVESVELDPGEVHEINDALVLAWRGGLIPLLDLGYSFGTAELRRRQGFAVILEVEGEHRALAVDRIHGLREVVVRGLDDIAGEPRGVGGTTILGDGRAVLILDPASLMELSPFGENLELRRGRWN
jgi:two-component system chemotaxis sensor kinase CheA